MTRLVDDLINPVSLFYNADTGTEILPSVSYSYGMQVKPARISKMISWPAFLGERVNVLVFAGIHGSAELLRGYTIVGFE